MNAPTDETIISPNLPNSYEYMLKESISRFLAEFHSGGSDFSGFLSIFHRLVQSLADPPLEIMWFYSAVGFHSSKSLLQGSTKKLLVSKDLFQCLITCSTPCNPLKKVAVLAPVIYTFHNSVVDLSKTDLCLGRQFENFIEGLVSYISMCCSTCSAGQERGLDTLVSCYMDLIGVWTVDQVRVSCKFVDDLRIFFPFLSDDIRLRINVGCGIDYLAGVVMNEIFLLRLQLKLRLGVWGENLRRNMAAWAVQTIKAFRNFNFFDMLLRMLLEPSFPVTTLLSSEEEVLLRKVLYDAVLLGDFPFLICSRSTQLNGNHLKDLALVWLLVADNAIQFVRMKGELAIAIAYMEAFSKSNFPNQLIKWVTAQPGWSENLRRQNLSTPKALIKWLLVLEDQGIRVFDQNISKVHAEAVVCNSRVNYEFPAYLIDAKNSSTSAFLDNEIEVLEEDKIHADQGMCYSLHDPFSTDACTVDPAAATTHGRRKREEEMNDGETRTKVCKYDFHENLIQMNMLPCPINHTSLTGSEIENTISDDGDEDMEDME